MPAQRAVHGFGSQPLRSLCFLKLLLVIGETTSEKRTASDSAERPAA